ncbi:hypothetical protein OAU93_00360 [bacterium]|nr:hypothetical protein [bacterium]
MGRQQLFITGNPMFLWVFGGKLLTLQFYPSDRGILRNSASGPVPKNAAFMQF